LHAEIEIDDDSRQPERNQLFVIINGVTYISSRDARRAMSLDVPLNS
jgi:hypothetical protein